MKTAKDWWKETTVYQIYPRSFKDSNGDGIGDLPGIISKLDYLQNLGFETLWISPFFSSPQKDFGYDIADYRGIAPEYGTMADCEKLIAQVHQRGMKIVFDMVMNHTSDQHPWFLESASSQDSPKRDWYIWRDGKGPGKPPTNWQAQVSGSGWQYHRETNQWYWAAFLPFQPDLNYRNPEVKAEMFDTLRFWLDKGVDGFRLDIIGAIYEDAEFRDNPFSWKLLPGEDSSDKLFQSTKMVENLPETMDFAKEIRAVVDEYEGCFLLGETFGSPAVLRDFTGREKPDGLHATFLFKSITTPFRASSLRKLIAEYEGNFPEPWIPTWVYANHDSMRRLTWFRGKDRMLRLQALLQHTARGIPVTYQGEEFAMAQGPLSKEGALDPIAEVFSWLPRGLFELVNRLTHGQLNRDGCRTPMQWDASRKAGFTSDDATPWLPFTKQAEARNAAVQEKAPESLLNLYRALLALRKGHSCLRDGTMEILRTDSEGKILGFRRGNGAEELRIYLNLSRRRLTLKLPATGRVLLDTAATGERDCEGKLTLAPWAGAVFQARGE